MDKTNIRRIRSYIPLLLQGKLFRVDDLNFYVRRKRSSSNILRIYDTSLRSRVSKYWYTFAIDSYNFPRERIINIETKDSS